MAIITTDKGFAIEFENDFSYPGQKQEHVTKNMAESYHTLLTSLIDTIEAAQTNDNFPGIPDYHTFRLLEAMLPTLEDTEVMIEKKRQTTTSATTAEPAEAV